MNARLNIFQSFAARFGVDEKRMMSTLKQTAFRLRADSDGNSQEVSDEQMVMLLIVANQYNLNPFTKELYAYPDKYQGIVPVVSVDGWVRIVNEHAQCDGYEFRYSNELVTVDSVKDKQVPAWMECVMYRKDRNRPTVVREYFDEVYRPPYVGKRRDNSTYEVAGPWQTHPRRLLRHKVFIQGSRVTFGFAGIFDQDEAERIIDMGSVSNGDDLHGSNQVVPQLTDESKKRVDDFMTQVLERAIASKAWEAAKQWVGDRLNPAEAAYARSKLEEAKEKQEKLEPQQADPSPATLLPTEGSPHPNAKASTASEANRYRRAKAGEEPSDA